MSDRWRGSGRTITDAALLAGGIAAEVMIAMVVLPHLAGRRALRITNTAVAILVFAGNLYVPPIDPDDWFFLVVIQVSLIGILRFGWTRFAPSSANGVSISADQVAVGGQ